MDFPAYVPAAVREHILTMIGRAPQESKGWAKSLEIAEKHLSGIEQKIAMQAQQPGNVEFLDSLRRQRNEAVEFRDRVASDVDCIGRLAHDARMRDAFALLTREFTDDQQWCAFIYSAWTARQDYSKYRGRLKRATGLKTEIADAATALAKLLRQFADTKVKGPQELFSIPVLLRQTDNYEMQGGQLAMWRSMRPHVLGDMPHDIQGERWPITTHEIILLRDYLESGGADIDSAEQARENVRYGWGVAPDLPALLDTVAKAARSCEPNECGMIGAALKTRQQNVKTEYLRAFGNQLTDGHGMALTAPIMQAMAIVANVAINMPDIDVTYDDVRKSLEKARQ